MRTPHQPAGQPGTVNVTRSTRKGSAGIKRAHTHRTNRNSKWSFTKRENAVQTGLGIARGLVLNYNALLLQNNSNSPPAPLLNAKSAFRRGAGGEAQNLMQLLCSHCSTEVPLTTVGLCPHCGGLLQPRYAPAALAQLPHIIPGSGLDRYRALLPTTHPLPFLGEGDTPLIHSKHLGPALGLQNLYFKNEGRNPTGAFKDRAASLAVALALETQARGLVTASSGNAASALAAYCAAVGLPCLILLEPGNPPNKLRQALATGARVIPVQGVFRHGPAATRDLLTQVAARLDYYLGFIWAPVNPLILEGLKTIAYEIAAQFMPEVVLTPVGGGDLLAAQWRGYLDWKTATPALTLPRLIGVQSTSAPPLAESFRAHRASVTPLDYANSKVSGINVPFSGDHALHALYDSHGLAALVPDDEIFAMQARLAREEGLWVEPAAAAPVAALSGLLAQSEISATQRIVCVLSGAGFKDSHLAETEAQALVERAPLPFDPEAIVRAAQ